MSAPVTECWSEHRPECQLVEVPDHPYSTASKPMRFRECVQCRCGAWPGAMCFCGWPTAERAS